MNYTLPGGERALVPFGADDGLGFVAN